MTNRHWILVFLVVAMLAMSLLGCSKGRQTQSTPAPISSSTAVPNPREDVPTDTPITRRATATPTPVLASPTATQMGSGPTLTDVQFALEIEQGGQLIYPAREFVLGVTRVYVRFSYQGFAGVTEVASIWYLNENRVFIGKLAWDGGEAGDYLIWVEDPNGLGRGGWRWELAVVEGARDEEETTPIGGGAFVVDGEASYLNEAWGLSFDPPAGWNLASETEDYVTYSSPDGRKGLALHFAAEAVELPEVAAAYLKLSREEHPEAEVETTEEVTMNGEAALVQQVRYADQEGGEEVLLIVSALHAGSAYSLWMLGPADEVVALKTMMMAALHSIRFSTGE
jgi:hypothetical protein